MRVNFKRDDDANIDGTSLKGYVHAKYKELESLFGKPLDSDGFKVSGEWGFTGEDGSVFRVYDYKQTELYDSELPSVKKFRDSDEVMEFNVGGRYSAVEFLSWLNEKIRDSRKK